MAITPDPGGEFLKAFSVADTSARDYQRIEMQRQAMAEAAVQRARENKANDFKLMMAALGRQDDNAYRQKQLEQQDFQNQTSRYGAETSRYGQMINRYQAMSPRTGTRNGDPLGLRGKYTGGSPTPSTDVPSGSPGIPEIPAIPGGDIEGGPDAALFGGPSPSSNPAYQTLSTQDRGGLPDGGATPSAPLVAESAPPAAEPPNYTPEALVPPPVQPVDNTPQPGAIPPPVTETPIPQVDAPAAPAAPLPMPDAARSLTIPSIWGSGSQTIPLPPSPMLNVPEVKPFGSEDMVSPLRDKMFELHKKSQEAAQMEKLEAARANKAMASMRYADPDAVPDYIAEVDDATRKSIEASGAAEKKKMKAADLARRVDMVQKRQDMLGSLTGLNGVLPAKDQAAILKEAADPKNIGQVDRKIATLAQYDAVRSQYGYQHRSQGYATAEKVVRAAQELTTEIAKKDERAWETAASVATLLAPLKEKPVDQLDPEEKKVKATLESEMLKNITGARLWEQRQNRFAKAIEADTVPEAVSPQPVAPPPVEAPAAPVAPGAPAGLGFMKTPEKDTYDAAQAEANTFWTEGKLQAADLGRVREMTDAEVRAVATGAGPLHVGTSDVGFGGGYEGTPYSETLASGFADKFKMPSGADNSKNRGRYGSVTPEDFLREAAKDELARRASQGNTPMSDSDKARTDAVRQKHNYK